MVIISRSSGPKCRRTCQCGSPNQVRMSCRPGFAQCKSRGLRFEDLGAYLKVHCTYNLLSNCGYILNITITTVTLNTIGL